MSLLEHSNPTHDTLWTALGHSSSPWARDALDAMREQANTLPPFHAWSHFAFIADNGATFEVDLLLCTPHGLFLVEFFGHEGSVEVDALHWLVQDTHGEVQVVDSPVEQARQKASKLHKLLEADQRAAHKAHKVHAPRIHHLVMLARHQTTLGAHHAPGDVQRIVHLDSDNSSNIASIYDVIERGHLPGVSLPDLRYTPAVLARLEMSLDRMNLAPAQTRHKVGDWIRERLIETSRNHQDWSASHLRRPGESRRVRIFFSPDTQSHTQAERLQKAARREFNTLRSLRHTHILRVEKLVQGENHPALIFEDHAGAMRLDLYIAARRDTMTPRERLLILRQICEAIGYAHRKQVIHRALTPQSVLIVPGEREPHVFVYNWQAALDRTHQTGTHHIEDYMADAAKVYTAPEVFVQTRATPQSDVWGLGAIAYLLFTGEAPASTSVDLMTRLGAQRGLRVSDALDGVSPELDELIYQATQIVAAKRLVGVDAFLQMLDEHVWRAVLGEPAPNLRVDPLDAEPGEELDGAWTVQRRLGSGASATALLVHDAHGNERVLKVFHTREDVVRMSAEHDALGVLAAESLIVGAHGCVEVGDRQALVLDYAGQTLRDRLAGERMSLDDLRRYGEDMCLICEALERHDVLHRDIKPANLGIGKPTSSGQRLMLFDFSLASSELGSVQVGTQAYRDPFLTWRGQWDEYADRYSAAITLYEMATGRLPLWRDEAGEESIPTLDPDATLDLDAERMPAHVREDLMAFFERALARDLDVRWADAGELLHKWRKVFDETTTTHHEETQTAVSRAQLDTSLGELEFSPAANEALDRLSLFTVRELLQESSQSFKFQQGTSGEVRNEIAGVRKQLQLRFPNVEREPVWRRASDPAHYSLEQCEEIAFGVTHGLDIAEAMGFRDAERASMWPSSAQMAPMLGKSREEVVRLLDGMARTWARDEALATLREHLVEIIARHEGISEITEAALALLGFRGSISGNEEKRKALALVMVRICVESEAYVLEQKDQFTQRFRLHRHITSSGQDLAGEHLFLLSPAAGSGGVLADLGRRADELASQEILPSSRVAYQELSSVLEHAGAPAMRQQRVLKVAMHASTNAALSSRDELYPRDIEAWRAIKLASSVLTTQSRLSQEDLVRRVKARYPVAHLPTGAELELEVERSGVQLVWLAAQSAYVRKGLAAGPYVSLSHSSVLGSYTSAGGSLHGGGRVSLDDFEQDLVRAREWGGFRVLMTAPHALTHTEEVLFHKFPELERVSIEEVWIDTLHELVDEFAAKGMPISWSVVLDADRPDRKPEEQANLEQLLGMAHKRIFETLRTTYLARDILCVHAGLLGRYERAGSMRVMDQLRDVANTDQGPRQVWLLIGQDRGEDEPKVGDVPVPRMSHNEVTRISRSWLHRARQNAITA